MCTSLPRNATGDEKRNCWSLALRPASASRPYPRDDQDAKRPPRFDDHTTMHWAIVGILGRDVGRSRPTRPKTARGSATKTGQGDALDEEALREDKNYKHRERKDERGGH